MCGHFNLVLNHSIDYENYRMNNHSKKARDIILANIAYRDLLDPFREIHDTMRKYSWKRMTPLQRRRLDCFLMSSSFKLFLRNCDTDIS